MRGNISGRKYIAFAIPVVPAAKVWSKKTLAACTQGAFCSGTLNLWTSVWDEEEEEVGGGGRGGGEGGGGGARSAV